ncbi:Golgi membrane protein 1 isoform X1 [Gouania willdenowi]|uniref:Golgi membrane protein 1 isoform X1 n=1 Tax=Gouania willdenowi TaxID=441366 RepID=UPI001054E818|nr:Golgi membrane protein 1 isoform X1 [Gouania willdenowi]
MMAGLTNGRRAGKTSSLLIAALGACSLVLGFNYWVSSSLSLELQTKLYHMEAQVRHGVAEREALELKKSQLETNLQKQLQQMNFIQNSYRAHEEDAEALCTQEKAILQQNISSSTQSILQLRDQLNLINNRLEELSNEVKKCEGNANDRINKYLADRDECRAQLQTMTQHCEEKVAATQLELEKKMQTINTAVGQSQENASHDGVKEEGAAHTDLKSNDIQLINDINGDTEQTPVKDSSDAEINQDKVVQSHDEENVELEKLENELPENKELDVDAPAEDPGMEELLRDQQHKGDVNDVNLQENYDFIENVMDNKREEITDEALEEKNDYNGDEDNEGEFEADKQVELTQL